MIYSSKEESRWWSNLVVSINLSMNAGISLSPQITVSGNNVYVVWTDETTAVNNDIFFKRNYSK